MSNTATEIQPNPAQYILKALGGRDRLSAMIGAYDFYSDGKSNETLVFKFKARAKKGIKYISITLNSKDTFDIEFIKFGKRMSKEWGFKVDYSETIKELENVYIDSLRDVIEDTTGLSLTINVKIISNI